MEILTTIDAMRRWTAAARSRGETVGLVPTMGALHEGHLELVRAAVRECGATVTSIFVNPAQFGPNEDLDRYPRDLKGDAALIEKEGCRAVFTAEADAIYPDGYETWVSLERLPRHLCGLDRPGHFRGVATVVAKLFHIVSPHRAYFGWKDAQQAIIIKRMVEDLNFDIDVRLLPIVRDEDGLALSSRNVYLSQEERRKALLIPGAVARAEEYFEAGGRDGRELLGEIEERFRDVEDVEVDYISLVRLSDLEDTDEVAPGTMLALAVRVGRTRLIDNCRFMENPNPESR
jgi:pantoate--beta-alanine ligase